MLKSLKTLWKWTHQFQASVRSLAAPTCRGQNYPITIAQAKKNIECWDQFGLDIDFFSPLRQFRWSLKGVSNIFFLEICNRLGELWLSEEHFNQNRNQQIWSESKSCQWSLITCKSPQQQEHWKCNTSPCLLGSSWRLQSSSPLVSVLMTVKEDMLPFFGTMLIFRNYHFIICIHFYHLHLLLSTCNV